MLSTLDVDEAASQLEKFRKINDSHHTSLAEILEKYGMLVQNYKRLSSDLEEERNTREHYKKLAKSQGLNHFVLVLIDGDNYIFEDDLIRNGADGGQRAAQLLNSSIKDGLRARGLHDCRIMVRIYANMSRLSRSLNKAKLAGPEKRSLAPFVAKFNESNEQFDFVDAGDVEGSSRSKICALFRQFIDNVQCRQIYFAGCHDPRYISELTLKDGYRDRITLIQGSLFHPEFQNLNFKVGDFPHTFRAAPLEDVKSATTAADMEKKFSVPSDSASMTPSMRASPPVCSFFSKGYCRHGAKCKFQHSTGLETIHEPTESRSNLTETNDLHQRINQAKSSLPLRPRPTTGSDNDLIGLHVVKSQSQPDFATMLPLVRNIPVGRVAVNKAYDRLDPYIVPATPEQKAAFNARTTIRKLCNHFQINGICQKDNECPYDHGDVPSEMLNCLKEIVFSVPCPRKTSCRFDNCLYGHVCQKPDCRYRGGKAYCKFPADVHGRDLNFAGTVPAHGAKPKEELLERSDVNNKETNLQNSAEEISQVTTSDQGTEEDTLLSPLEGSSLL